MKSILAILSVFSLLLVACGGGESTESTEATGTEEVSTETINNTETAAEDAAPQGPFATMEFATYEHDFGTIKEGEVVEHTFTFTNNGETDLIISNAKGSCGCTVPYYPKEPIAPGETGELKISYDSKGKKGTQRKTVTINANTNPGVTTLNITSEVVAADGTAN